MAVTQMMPMPMQIPSGMEEQFAQMQKIADEYNAISTRLQSDHNDLVAFFAPILCVCRTFDVYHCPIHSDVSILERVSPWVSFESIFPNLRLGSNGAPSA